MAIAIVGIDLGKNSCSVAGLDGGGAVACGGACRGRTRRVRGRAVGVRGCDGGLLRRASPRAALRGAGTQRATDVAGKYVQPYAKAQKNDDRDAEAIAEAATRPTLRFVEIKQEAQLDMQTLHRARVRA